MSKKHLRSRSSFKLSIFGLVIGFLFMGLNIGLAIAKPDPISISCSVASVFIALFLADMARIAYMDIKAFDDEND